MAAPRTIASNAAPAGRRDQTETVGTTRPELHVVKGTRAEGNGVKRGFKQLITWTRTRSTPLLHLVIAVIFLGICLVGSLMLRTQMVQDSFDANRIESNIIRLTQDVEMTRPSSTSLRPRYQAKPRKWVWCLKKVP